MSEDPFVESAVTPERIGLAAFAGTVPVFAYLGHVLFEDVLFGGLVGIALGTGVLLSLQYFLWRSVVERGDAPAAAMAGGDAQRAAAGMALTVGGFAVLSGGFVLEGELLRPLLAGAVVSIVAFVPIDRALPRLSSLDGAEG